MDTLYDHNAHAVEQQEEEKEGISVKNRAPVKKLHSSTFDMIPVLTSKRMRKTIKDQIIDQLEKINK